VFVCEPGMQTHTRVHEVQVNAAGMHRTLFSSFQSRLCWTEPLVFTKH